MVIFPRVGFRPTLRRCLAQPNPTRLHRSPGGVLHGMPKAKKSIARLQTTRQSVCGRRGWYGWTPVFAYCPFGRYDFFSIYSCAKFESGKSRRFSPVFALAFFRLLLRGEAPPAGENPLVDSAHASQVLRRPPYEITFAFLTQPNFGFHESCLTRTGWRVSWPRASAADVVFGGASPRYRISDQLSSPLISFLVSFGVVRPEAGPTGRHHASNRGTLT